MLNLNNLKLYIGILFIHIFCISLAQEISFGLPNNKTKDSLNGYFILNYFPNMVDTTKFLKQEDKEYLLEILNFVEKHPNTNFRLEIHENTRANEEYQLIVSNKIAESVSEFMKLNRPLIKNLEIEGMGCEKPILEAIKEDNSDFFINRRLELHVIEN